MGSQSCSSKRCLQNIALLESLRPLVREEKQHIKKQEKRVFTLVIRLKNLDNVLRPPKDVLEFTR